MGRAKNWDQTEIAAACRAYAAATENALQGADMRIEDFLQSCSRKLNTI